MRRTALIVIVFILGVTACNSPKTETTESTADTTSIAPPPAEKTEAAAPAMDSAAMMKAWEDFRTPGEMHKLLESWNGQWTAEVSSWMDPSQPPVKSQATYLLNPIMSGLFQTGHLSGTMMGMHFDGRSTTGYDNAKKIFVSTWIDNLGSGIIMMTGSWDEASKTLHYKGFQTDPVTGKDSPIRQEQKVVDENTLLLTMYGTDRDGKEQKFMEALYKRN